MPMSVQLVPNSNPISGLDGGGCTAFALIGTRMDNPSPGDQFAVRAQAAILIRLLRAQSGGSLRFA